jgi:hypothetical protein
VYGDDAYEVDVEDIEKIVEINDVEETTTDPETTTTEPVIEDPDELPENVKEIIAKIKNKLDEYGLGFLEDIPMTDEAIIELARLIGGDLTLEEIIETLSGDFDIPGVGTVNLSDLLNQLLATIEGLFGDGGGDTPTTTKPTTTNGGSNGDTDDTTADGGDDNNGGELGDAGIALAVSVCLAAAAAFVITKKKQDE